VLIQLIFKDERLEVLTFALSSMSEDHLYDSIDFPFQRCSKSVQRIYNLGSYISAFRRRSCTY